MKVSPKKIENMPNFLAGLQLDRYLVDDLIFKCNKFATTKDDKPIDPTIGIDFNVKGSEQDENIFLLDMVVDLNAGQAFKKFQLHQIHLHLYGWFRFTTPLDEPTKEKMLFTNASSILYGVARSIVANLTGSLGASRYILPSVNLLEIVKAKSGSSPEKTRTATKRVGKS